jgi:hypothetical protein
METLLQLLGVFALSVVELWAAVPAGVALGLPPILVWLATVAGALVCIVVVLAGGRLRSIWERYGVIGWGLLGAPRGRLLIWLGAGVLLWTTILTVAAASGIEAVRDLG